MRGGEMTMTSRDRVFAALAHREPDRVPQFLSTTLTGARELGMTIQEYFSRPENVVEGQLQMQRRFRNDCYLGFLYGALEVEAFGGEVIFVEDGPPNAGAPILSHPEDISRLEPPDPRESPVLRRTLDVIRGLKERGDPSVPILGMAISPYSLPVMQMGFPAYLDLMEDRPELLRRLLEVNEAFAVAWGNAQFEAGITGLTYFDPLASPSIVPSATYRETGKPLAQRILRALQGPAVIHLASGRVLGVVDDLVEVGAVGLGAGDLEDAGEVREACRGRITMVGNLNGVAMARWAPEDAEQAVKDLLRDAGPGGGFILSDGHGELPWQVSDEVILAVSEAVHRWGTYPLNWVEETDA